jgi:hypothetical protein
LFYSKFKSCSRLHTCSTCKINYSTYQALVKHARKKGHEIHTENPIYNIARHVKQTKRNESINVNYPNMPIRASVSDPNSNSYQFFFIKDIKMLNSSTNNILLLPNFLPGSQVSLENDDKKIVEQNNLDADQRSFGCQTSNLLVSTQETASQTFNSQLIINTEPASFQMSTASSTSPLQFDLLNASSSNIINRETQTQTSTFEPGSYDYLDATTSTSPINYLDSMFDPLNDKFTQTARSNANECHLDFEQSNLSTSYLNKSINTIGISTATITTQLDDCIYSQEFVFDNILNSSNSGLNNSIKLTQHNQNYKTIGLFTNNNRCITPTANQTSSLYSISCQTENDLYQENIINTMDTITQTDWEFSA